MLLLYGLTVATGSGSSLADYFWWMIALCVLNGGVGLGAGALCAAVDARRQQRCVRLADCAAGCRGCLRWWPVLPGVFLFGISAQFINGTINSWFGNDTHEALERSLNLK